ncbi:MAG: glycosyltransferase family 4 protein [Clostridiales bacterium]|nr:glycosyltransferase family 4 protein [Clostridiales bacterium]
MKIAMIGHKRVPSREGGVEIVVEELAARMAALGHRVDVYNRSGRHVSGREYAAHAQSGPYRGMRLITVPTFPSDKLNALVYAALATLRALFGRYDVIHYHAEGPCAMLWLRRLFGIRTVATIHGLDWQRAKWGGFAKRYLLYGERCAVRCAGDIIVLSENMRRYFREQYGRETVFIPNGVGQPDPAPAEEITRRWGLVKDGYILYLGRIVPEKGLHYLIEAYRQLHTDQRLVVAGGSSHTDAYLRQVREAARDDGRILFTGFVQGQALAELYGNAYLYVLPSDLEGMPLSLLEAMSYGNCCLVSDIPENTEVVGDHAATFAHGSADALRQSLAALLADPAVVRAYKAGARAHIESRHGWDAVAAETLALYAARPAGRGKGGAR